MTPEEWLAKAQADAVANTSKFKANEKELLVIQHLLAELLTLTEASIPDA